MWWPSPLDDDRHAVALGHHRLAGEVHPEVVLGHLLQLGLGAGGSIGRCRHVVPSVGRWCRRYPRALVAGHDGSSDRRVGCGGPSVSGSACRQPTAGVGRCLRGSRWRSGAPGAPGTGLRGAGADAGQRDRRLGHGRDGRLRRGRVPSARRASGTVGSCGVGAVGSSGVGASGSAGVGHGVSPGTAGGRAGLPGSAGQPGTVLGSLMGDDLLSSQPAPGAASDPPVDPRRGSV